MFFPFNLREGAARKALHQQVLDWCQAESRNIYLDNEIEGTTTTVAGELAYRTLNEVDLAMLEEHLNLAEQNLEFGGFVGGLDLKEINSLCFFTLDEAKERACLSGFVTNNKLALDSSPLQSALLLLPLAALLRQEQSIESFYLPFHEIWQEDFISIALYHFAPGSESGWWQQANTQTELGELLAFPLNGPVENWLELRMEVEPDLLDYITRLFSRSSYEQRLIVVQPNPEKHSLAILQAYLPAGKAAEVRIDELRQSLSSLSALRSLARFSITDCTPAYYEALWNQPNLFRLSEHILLTPDRKDFVCAPGERLIEIPPSINSFSLGPDGPHSTTALCLQLLEKHLDPSQHTRLLDLGTGSGTLAIVASYLGVEKILALDTFRPAVDAARRNVIHNGVSDRIRVEAGSLAVRVKKDALVYSFSEEAQRPPFGLDEWLPFDLIVSNTFDHVLIGLATALFEALRPGGLLITSGILEQKAEGVIRAFEAVGLKFLDQLEDDNWISFAHYRPTEAFTG